MSQAHQDLDPYTSQAEHHSHTPQEKINGLREIIKSVKTAMLTTRSADGQFHARAMNLASPSGNDNKLSFIFLANNASHKFEEIQNDSNVNVSFLNPSTSSWASISGKARISTDRNEVKAHWSSVTSAWFGDLKDGVHKGDSDDPRVAVIEVVPDEIRYWYPTSGKIGRALEVGFDSLTGKTASPGEIRTITKSEIQLTQGLNKQQD